MRTRLIKPGFFTNVDLADIGPHGMLLFAGIWCIADREGRLEDRPRQIQAQVLPYFQCDVDALLSDLAKHGFIDRYEVDGARFVQIVKWTEHQTPHPRELQSKIPKSPCMKTQVGMHENLECDPYIQNQDQKKNQKRDQDQERSSDGFLAFWLIYPRKEKRERAHDSWRKLTIEERVVAMDDVPRRMKMNWLGVELKLIPHPTTYLNQKLWHDDLIDLSQKNGNQPPRRLTERNQDIVDEIFREREEKYGSRAGTQNSIEGQSELVPPAVRRDNHG